MKVKDVGIVISDLMGGDYSIHFIELSLMDEFVWLPGETGSEHTDRVSDVFGQAAEDEDPRILYSEYTQAGCNPDKVNLGFPINVTRVVSVRSC